MQYADIKYSQAYFLCVLRETRFCQKYWNSIMLPLKLDFTGIFRKFDSRKSVLKQPFWWGWAFLCPFYEEIIKDDGKRRYFLEKSKIFNHHTHRKSSIQCRRPRHIKNPHWRAPDIQLQWVGSQSGATEKARIFQRGRNLVPGRLDVRVSGSRRRVPRPKKNPRALHRIQQWHVWGGFSGSGQRVSLQESQGLVSTYGKGKNPASLSNKLEIPMLKNAMINICRLFVRKFLPHNINKKHHAQWTSKSISHY